MDTAGCPCALIPACPAPCHGSGETDAREERQRTVLQEGSVNEQSHAGQLSPHCASLPGTSDNWNRSEDACRTWGRCDVMGDRYHGSSTEMQERRQIVPMLTPDF